LEKGNIPLQDFFNFIFIFIFLEKKIIKKGGVWGQVCHIFILG
jgi:hypothetical protein